MCIISKPLNMVILLLPQALCHSSLRRSHLLPSQLPGEHTGHKAASRCSEPLWNAHYSSTHHHCWYSFYLPTEGWKVESNPSQVEVGVGIEPRTCCITVPCSTNWVILAGYIHIHAYIHTCIHSIITSIYIHMSVCMCLHLIGNGFHSEDMCIYH